LLIVGSPCWGVIVATPVPASKPPPVSLAAVMLKSISSTLGLLGLAYKTWLVSALIWLMASRSEPAPLSAVVVTTYAEGSARSSSVSSRGRRNARRRRGRAFRSVIRESARHREMKVGHMRKSPLMESACVTMRGTMTRARRPSAGACRGR